MPVPLRVLALFIVVSALVLTTLATALADSHPAAADGQRLEDQSAEVQALYRAVYGDDAEARWIAEHNAAIGMSMMDDMMMGDMSMDDPTSNMYYDRIVAVAMARGADAELANRIAVDVISRGTEAEFLAGTDAGVLYGIGRSEDEINAGPAPSAPSGGGGGGGGTAAPAAVTGSGLFVRVSAPKDQTLITGEALTTAIQLPDASVSPPSGYGPTTYTASGYPSGLTFTADNTANDATLSTLSGTPVFAGEYLVTYTATQKDNNPDDDGENNADKKPDLTSSFTFTITVVANSVPAFVVDDVDDLNLLANSGMWEMTLPEATKGNGALVYAATGDAVEPAAGAWLKFNKDTRVLSGSVGAAAGATTITYTVADSDVFATVGGNPDTDTIEFSITITADSTPTLTAPTDAATLVATVGLHYTLVLDPATAGTGNGKITYSVSGLPAGLSFDAATRTINGVPDALPSGVSSQVHPVKYMAVDEDGDEATAVTFNITVNG